MMTAIRVSIALGLLALLGSSNVVAQHSVGEDMLFHKLMLGDTQQYQVLFRMGLYKQSVDSATEALQAALEARDEPNAFTAAMYYNHGLVSLLSGKSATAIESLIAADAMFVALGGEANPKRIAVLISLGSLTQAGDKARAFFDEAIALSQMSFGVDATQHAENQYSVGLHLLKTDDWRHAKTLLIGANETFVRSLSPLNDQRVASTLALSRWRILAGEDTSAALRETIAGYEKRDRSEHPYYRQALELLVENARQIDEPAALSRAESALLQFDQERAERRKTINEDYLPIVHIAPRYPVEALSQKIEGYVDLRFTVLANGSTTKIEPIGGENLQLFADAAIEAVRLYKYKPRVVEGNAVDTDGAEVRLRFKLQ